MHRKSHFVSFPPTSCHIYSKGNIVRVSMEHAAMFDESKGHRVC